LHNQRVTAAVTATASLGLGLVGTMPQNGIATQGENKWVSFSSVVYAQQMLRYCMVIFIIKSKLEDKINE